MRALLALICLIACAAAASAAPTSRVLNGGELAGAAESFVRQHLASEARSVYQVPDRTVPVGSLMLSARWSGTAPAQGYNGRITVPVAIHVNGKLLREVTVLVEVGTRAAPTAATNRGLNTRSTVRSGDTVTLTFVSDSGARIQMQGTAQQAGNVGERVRVALRNPSRVLVGRVASDREVMYED